MGTSDQLISAQNDLIRATIRPLDVTYYLVTEEQLRAVKAKSLVADVFTVLTSLSFGAFISVLLTVKVSTSLRSDVQVTLNTYRSVFLVLSVALAIITTVSYVSNYLGLLRVTSSKRLALSAPTNPASPNGHSDQSPSGSVVATIRQQGESGE